MSKKRLKRIEEKLDFLLENGCKAQLGAKFSIPGGGIKKPKKD